MDGFEMKLPRTKDILANDYQGRWVGTHRQQYYPTMYTVSCIDVLSGHFHGLRFSAALDERALAKPMVETLEEGSVCIYDRGYPSHEMIRLHKQAKNHFIFRLRSNSFREAVRLLNLKIARRKTTIEGVVVHFVKIKNPKTRKFDLFATSLPKGWTNAHTIRSLYNLRWECETSFLDLVNTFKLEQWHSKTLNGVLQELYAALWLYNFSKGQILLSGQIRNNPLDWTYSKPNFKLITDRIIRYLGKIFQRFRDLGAMITKLIIKSTERRRRHSRSKPRETKYSASPYPANNVAWTIDPGPALN